MTDPSIPRATVSGTGVRRKDIVEKVTGSAVYTSDLEVPEMAHAALVRSTVAHGLLREIDVSAASALPGVRLVATAADFANYEIHYGESGSILDQPFLAMDRVRYIGEPVAGIVADDAATAVQAAHLVRVGIDSLPVLGSADEALSSRTLIHPELAPADGVLPGEANVCSRTSFEYGDVDAALAVASFVHEAVYTFPAVYHYAMEPFVCIASWGPGGLDLWTGTQQPHKVRADMARMFDVPLSKVRVRVPYVGGAYGSKGQSKYEPVTAGLAKLAACPVKLQTSVHDAFHTISRHAARIEMRTAVDHRGDITARDTRIVYDTGAYADMGPRVARKGAYRAAGPYCIPNTRSVALAVYSNRVPAGAFRGFATPQVVWAGESAVDEVAAHLGEDPVEFRRRRLTRRGEPFLGDDAPMDADLAEGIELAARSVGWDAGVLPAGRGRGVASAVKDGGGGGARSEAEVHLLKDGSIEVVTSAVEIGQGAQTALAQLAADGLAADYDAVTVRIPDTFAQRIDPGTNASRTTVAVGSAVYRAAQAVYRDLCAATEQMAGHSTGLRLSGSDVVASDGTTIPLVEVMSAARRLPPEVLGAMSAVAADDTPTESGPLGSMSAFYEVSHAAAEVEVDRETGVVHLRHYVSVPDVGYAINPATCEGQDEGATVMGIGHTLFEELTFARGELVNPDLVGYRVPRTTDLPARFDTVLLENADGPGPFGAKGVGEGGIIAVAPAVANAVADALGIRIRDLPLTPERVWRAIQEAERRSVAEDPGEK